MVNGSGIHRHSVIIHKHGGKQKFNYAFLAMLETINYLFSLGSFWPNTVFASEQIQAIGDGLNPI